MANNITFIITAATVVAYYLCVVMAEQRMMPAGILVHYKMRLSRRGVDYES